MHTYMYIHKCVDLCPIGNDFVEIESHTYQKLLFRLRDPMYIYIYIYTYAYIYSYMGNCRSGRETPLVI